MADEVTVEVDLEALGRSQRDAALQALHDAAKRCAIRGVGFRDAVFALHAAYEKYEGTRAEEGG